MNIKKILLLAEQKGIADFEIKITKKESKEVELFERKTDKYEVSNVEEASIRGIYNGKLGRITIENPDIKALDDMLDLLIDNCKAITSDEPVFIFEGSKKYLRSPKKNSDIADIDMAKKLEDLYLLNDLLEKADKRIYKINVSYSEVKENIVIANSKGLNLKKGLSYGVFVCSADIKDGEDIRTEFNYEIKSDYNEINVKRLAKKTSDRLISKLHPVQVDSASYDIVLENDAVVSLLGAFSSIFSGMAAIRNTTLLKDKVGQLVFGKNITIYDDPVNANCPFTHTFDDEGVACVKKEVVSKGVLKTLLHNLKTAAILKSEPTGNGFYGSVMPANMYLKPDNHDFNELVEKAENGLFITELDGLHSGLNPVSGDFSCKASGFRIENGKVTYPVSLIVISGNIVDLLNNVAMIADDMVYSPNRIGAPAILVSNMKISGK